MPGLAAPSAPAGVVVLDVEDPGHARDPGGVTITAHDPSPALG